MRKSTGGPALPMPFAGRRGGAKFSRAEWNEYHQRHGAHLKRFPDYDAGWHRPDPLVVEATWPILERRLPAIKTMLPAIVLDPRERQNVTFTIQQAVIVALSIALLAGERGWMLTTNRVFDALARCWSDTYRATIEAGRATISYEMRAETVRASWRDLLRNGIDLALIWDVARQGCPGLYTTARVPERGYIITRDVGSPTLQAFSKATTGYRRGVMPARLLLADEIVPPRPPISQKTAGEWHYNVVTVGERSERLMDQLEAARFFLDVKEFLKTVDKLEDEAQAIQAQLLNDYQVDVTLSAHRPRGSGRRSALQWGMKYLRQQDVPTVKVLVEQHRRLVGHLAQAAPVYEQVYAHAADEYLEIRSGMSKDINRRYTPRHFWPLEVTGKDIVAESQYSGGWFEDQMVDVEIIEETSRRGRWFRAAAITPEKVRDNVAEEYGAWPNTWDIQPLVGFDVSASQVQILSVFLGLDNLEAQVTHRPHKELLAEVLWTRDQDRLDSFSLPTTPEAFSGPDDPKLKNAGKTAVMTRLYGSEAREIAHKLRSAPLDFGPGLGDAQNIARLFDHAGLDEILNYFLPACQAMAERLCRRDPYLGFVFRDPYDQAPIRWNPVRLRPKPVTSADMHLYVNLPVGKPNAAGNYPVDEDKLGRMMLPCLVHTMDSAFAGFVVEALQARGVKDVVSVHDCWMVADEAENKLLEAVRAAGEPWLRSLGPIYDALVQAIGDDPVFGPRVRKWRAEWRKRVKNKRWPEFLVSKAKLWDRDAAIS